MIGIEAYGPPLVLFETTQMARQPPNAIGVFGLPSHLGSQATTFIF